MKIVFFGTPNFVDPLIASLENKFELVKTFRNPKQLNDEAIEELKGLEPDLFVVASFGKIFPGDFLNIPRYGTINVHPSLLPKYRGPTPVQTAILNGDKKTGITIIKIDEEVDHGPILSQEELEILENETSESLLKRVFEKGAKMLPEVISNYIKGQIIASAQDDSKATYTEHLTRQSGYIDFSNELEIENWKLKIERAVRAYYPWPGVWFKSKLKGKEQRVIFLPEKKIQVEGKKPMSYKDFINGYKEGEVILSTLGVF